MSKFVKILLCLLLSFGGPVYANSGSVDTNILDLSFSKSVSDFDFISKEYNDINDPSIPQFLKKFINESLTREEIEKLINRKLSIAVSYVRDSMKKRQIDRDKKVKKRKLKENNLLKDGESVYEIGMINDNQKQPSVVGFVSLLFGVEDGNDRGATHLSEFKYTKNFNRTTNIKLEFSSSLNTEKAGPVTDCGDGTENECQKQNFLAKIYFGGGIEKQKFDESTGTETRIGVVGGLVERNAHKFNRFFDSANHQMIYHDFLNGSIAEGSAREYDNQARKDRYDLGGYVKLSADATQNLLMSGGKFMISVSGGGMLSLETNGAKRMDVWMSAGATYHGKKANHGFEFFAGVGLHNRALKTELVEGEKFVPIRDFGDPVINNILEDIWNDSWVGTSQSSVASYGVGLDCKIGFNYTYDRGFWRIKSGITSRCGEKDMSGEYEDKGKVDYEYNTSLILTPKRKRESIIGEKFREAMEKYSK